MVTSVSESKMFLSWNPIIRECWGELVRRNKIVRMLLCPYHFGFWVTKKCCILIFIIHKGQFNASAAETHTTNNGLKIIFKSVQLFSRLYLQPDGSNIKSLKTGLLESAKMVEPSLRSWPYKLLRLLRSLRFTPVVFPHIFTTPSSCFLLLRLIQTSK